MAVAVNGSVIVIVGKIGGSLEMPLALLSRRNLTIHGSHVGTLDELKDLLRFAAKGRLQPSPFRPGPCTRSTRYRRFGGAAFCGRVAVVPD